ncbi:MAG: hypothetical protein QOH32_1567 [Bradyrhizobium sp.]|nr:hypothetical protein [Bradyrhizobium sp.]
MIMVWTRRVRPFSIIPKEQKDSSGDSTSREPWVDPDDASEITDELLDRVWKTAEIRKGGRIIRPGRPPVNSGVGGTPEPGTA